MTLTKKGKVHVMYALRSERGVRKVGMYIALTAARCLSMSTVCHIDLKGRMKEVRNDEGILDLGNCY
jgi:hypothetical protein